MDNNDWEKIVQPYKDECTRLKIRNIQLESSLWEMINLVSVVCTLEDEDKKIFERAKELLK